MKSKLCILHLEDDVDDAALIQSLLAEQGIVCEMERVDTREAFIAALERGGFDLIISDFSLPSFDGLSALELAREIRPEVPFLFVSGTLGEEVAIGALKSGATDYVLKHRLPRLVPAVHRAVAEMEERQALQRAEAAMIQSEFKYRQLFECLSEAALLADANSGRVLDANRQAEVLLGCSRAEILGLNVNRLLSDATLIEYRRMLGDADSATSRVVFEGEVLSKDGHAISVAISAAPILLYGRRLILGLYRDVTDRKQAEEAIQRLKTEMESHLRAQHDYLEEPDTLTTTFLAGMEEVERALHSH